MKILSIFLLSSLFGGIQTLFAQSSPAVLTVKYHRHENDYTDWKLWVWNATDSKAGFEVSASSKDDFGLCFKIDLTHHGLSGKTVGILPKYKNWEMKDDPDRKHSGKTGEIFIVQSDPAVHSSKPDISAKIADCSLEHDRTVRILFTKPVSAEFVMKNMFSLMTPEKQYAMKNSWPESSGQLFRSIRFDFDLKSIDFISVNRGEWQLKSRKFGNIPVRLGSILDSSYFHPTLPLGPIYENNALTLRVFAPTAFAVSVLLSDTESFKKPVEIPMDYAEKGVWECILEGDTEGLYYLIRVKRNGGVFEGIDPYSQCNTAHNGAGVFVKDSTPIARCPHFHASESVIYELHIRDFTIDPDSGIRRRGKYLGLTESGTRLLSDEKIKTGLDHLKELGINVVQIMPIQDFENNEHSEDYNWGYMPVHFNSPDGWYATNTADTSRIKEFKLLVSELHKRKMKAVMDVVYNHTAETNSNICYGFNALVRDYYYRTRPDGSYWNGSGCGNEFRSESFAGRKFIIDSLKYWVTEYDIDGFRFDLMGLIDIETISQVVAELKKIKPDILIYGEPWTAGDTPIHKTEKGSQKGRGFAVFNDNFRDAVKGSVWDMSPGYVQNGSFKDRIISGILGSIYDFTDSPCETINYSNCHDNHTLWDRILLSTKGTPMKVQKEMNKLSAALILTSQGIPFLHSGEEFLRSKGGEHNSYNLPDSINRIEWMLKKKNRDIFTYYRGLIRMRHDHPAFRMKYSYQIKQNIKFYEEIGIPLPDPRCIGYILNAGAVHDNWNIVVVLFNPTENNAEFDLPDGVFKKALDNKKYYPEGSGSYSKKITVLPHSAAIYFQ